MKDRIRQRALELGFDDCRFTTAEPPASAAAFERWLEAGCHGTMDWLVRNRERRLDPRRVLPQARSVIVLTVSYHRGTPVAPSVTGAGPSGCVARYARATDYHDVLAAPLKALAAYVDSLASPAARSLVYVDTGPLLERDLAARAGAGFVGKHTNLVSRRLGNWFFLAEILTPLELDPDPAEPNRCGRCQQCLESCPTQAITAPFHLDARRCIAYLTIELKGSIPVEFRPAIGARVFGCDECLEVCPWNRFARSGRLLRDVARTDLDQPALLELLSLDEGGFRQRFKETPLARAKRRGLRRNTCVALGNVGGPEALPALRHASTDPEPLVAEHARWALAQVEARLRHPAA